MPRFFFYLCSNLFRKKQVYGGIFKSMSLKSLITNILHSNSSFFQLIRYGFVGGVAFIADYAFLYVFTEYVGLPYLLSAAISFIIGLIVNYALSILFVFSSRVFESKHTEFIIFAIIGVAGLGWNEVIMYLCSSVIGLHYMLAKIISAVIVFFWNFFARKFILFSTSKKSS